MAKRIYEIDDSNVVVVFTKKEHAAVSYALGNSMDYEDIVASLFPNKRNMQAAMRGYGKLKNACYYD